MAGEVAIWRSRLQHLLDDSDGNYAVCVARGLGIHPIDVADALRERGYILTHGDEQLLPPNGPVPHPIDADWRYHPETVAKLLGELHGTDSVALLGAPSLASALGSRGYLWENNDAWRPFVGACNWGLPTTPVSIAIADPPWYPNQLTHFLSVAARITACGGTLLLSWPGKLTRPGITSEFDLLVANAPRLGFELESVTEGAIRYATPWFEAQAMRAAGAPVLAAWRVADLVRFIRTGESSPIEVLTPRIEWRKVTYGRLDLRVRIDLPDPKTLQSLIPGDVLASVSRRHATIPSVQVWTSGNRVYRVGNGVDGMSLDDLEKIESVEYLSAHATSARSVAG